MSTSENNETPPLTRRQLREIRNTGATPIISTPPVEPERDAPVEPPAVEAPEAVHDDVVAPTTQLPAHDEVAPEPEAPRAQEAPTPAEAPARPAASVFEPPLSDAELGVGGLTRRQARAQEKIRTASVPVITPDPGPGFAPAAAAHTEPADAELPAIFRPAAPEDDAAPAREEDEAPVASTVNPALGSDLLNGATPEVTLPDSFDQLIARSGVATGSVSTPNALILSQTPASAPLVAPVTATGEVMITGTFELPDGLGSIGHAPGTTDGRDADAVLLDGELPPASSPTPIAASAAISTVKQPGEIIRPPAPEKGSKLLVGLIITTGALALAVAVTLVLAFTTGVFR